MKSKLNNCNIGNYNIGYENVGSCNTGSFNSGHFNIGNFNAGSFNKGNCNTGSFNRGSFNIGSDNIGDFNAGIGNLSHSNTGDFNTGNFNTGVFNTTSECIRMFNKDTNLTYDEWLNSDVREILISNFYLIEWVKVENMTDIEKREHEEYEVLGGYLKIYTYEQAWKNLWNNITQEEKQKIMNLPNFDKEIFQEITGIEIK